MTTRSPTGISAARRQCRHGLVILGGDAPMQRQGGHGAVHGTGIEPFQPEPGRHGLGHRRLPRPGRAVDGHDRGSRATTRLRTGQPGQFVGEARIAGGGGAEAGDDAPRPGCGSQCGHRGRHGHPVIALTVEAGTDASDSTRPTPVMDSVSPSTSAVAPKAVTMSITAASRSTSLTRNSPTSRNSVVPSATAAATARAGISSSEGISAASTTVPRSGPNEAVKGGGAAARRRASPLDRPAHPLQH